MSVEGEGSGFSEAGAALGAISKENSWLQQQISSGGLKMDPEAAEAGAKVYEDKADKVSSLINRADRLQHLRGLGDYPSGQQLANKFKLKARNGSSGAADLLGQLRNELQRKADLYRQAKKDYRVTDEQAADEIRRSAQ